MDFFQHPYYRTVKILLKITGQWPHQSTFYSSAVLGVSCIIGISLVVPQIVVVMKHRDDILIVLQSALTLIIIGIVSAKGICSRWNTEKIFQLMSRIRTDWQVWTLNEEVNILHDYAELGRMMVLGWVVSFTLIATVFVISPAMPKIIDMLLGNGSKPGMFATPMDYHYFDEQEYYFYIIAHVLISGQIGFFNALPFDCVFIVSVQHACGIFAALGHKLNEIGKNRRLEKGGGTVCVSDKEDTDFKNLVWCIRRHNDAIEYVDLIESTFLWSFFITVGLNMLGISLAGYQIVKCTDGPQELARLTLDIIAGLGHIYFESYMAQILMDHSMTIHNSIISSDWYNMSPKIQKLLYVMMIRCNDSSQLTAGKIIVMCCESFTSIVKTSMSFLTLLRSL